MSIGDSEAPSRVLIVDDEPGIVDVLETYLRDEGFDVTCASDGLAAIEKAQRERPALVILDLNLPKLSGLEVFHRIRAHSHVPVIMLTSRTGEVDRVVGLELGADDYVGKPFSPREVVARVKSVLRRSRPYDHDTVGAELQRIGELEIDRRAHEVRRAGTLLELTPTEFRLLDTLASEVGRAFTRDRLLEVMEKDQHVFDRTLDRHVANLRAKVEPNPREPLYIVTVLGVGYKMAAVR